MLRVERVMMVVLLTGTLQLVGSCQGVQPLPPDADKLIRNVQNYPPSLPMIVVRRLATFQFSQLDQKIQDQVTSRGPIGTLGQAAKNTLALESQFAASKNQLLNTVVLQRSSSWSPSPNPIAALRLSQVTPLVSPAHQKLNRFAEAVLQRGLASLLRPDLTIDELKGFAASSHDGPFDDDSAASSFLATALPYFRSDVSTDPIFQALAATSRAEVIQMTYKHVKSLLDSGNDPAALLMDLSLTRQGLTAAQMVVGENVQSIHRLGVAVHDLVSQEESLSKNVLDAQEKYVNEVSNFYNAVETAAKGLNSVDLNAILPPAPATPEQIGTYVDAYSSKINQVRAASALIDSLADGSMSTSQILSVATKLSDQLPPSAQVLTLIPTLNNLLSHQTSLSSTVEGLLTNGNTIASNLANDLGGLFPGVPLTGSMPEIADIAGAIIGGSYGQIAGAIPGLDGVLGGLGFGGNGQNKALLSKLAEMDGKLDNIISSQQKIIEGIDKVNQSVMKLTEAVIEDHKETMAKLANIDKDILINRQITLSSLAADYKDCYNLIPRGGDSVGNGPLPIKVWDPTSKSRDYQDLLWTTFPNYTQQYLWLSARLESFTKCSDFLSANLLTVDSLNPLLQFQANTPVSVHLGGQPQQYLDGFVLPHFTELRKHYPTESKLLTAITGLAIPSLSVDDLERKWSAVSSGDVPSTDRVVANVVSDSNEGAFITAPMLVEVADVARAVMPIWTIVDPAPANNPCCKAIIDEKIAATPSWFTSDRIATIHRLVDPPLENLLVLLNSSIVQQAVISGDLLLPFLAADLPSASSQKPWLVSNKILRRNLILLMTKRWLKSAGSSTFLYSIALSTTSACPAEYAGECYDRSLISEVLDHGGALKSVLRHRHMVVDGGFPNGKEYPSCGGQPLTEDGWHVELGPNLCQQLPSVDEVQSGRLWLTAEQVELLRARENVMDLIASMRFRQGQGADAAYIFAVLATTTPIRSAGSR